MNERVRAKALKTLDGMEQIVRNEMLVKGQFLTDIRDEKLAQEGAICGGRRACLLGSAWVAYGIKPDDAYGDLPGIYDDERKDFLRPRPALRAVYDSLNTVAERRFARDPGLVRKRSFGSAAEALFEGNYGSKLDRRAILRLIASARREIEKA